MPVILTFFNTRDLYLSVRRTPKQTDIDVTCSRSCDQGKITNRLKTIRVEKNRFLKKCNPPVFCFFNPNYFVFLFEKKQVFVLFKKNTKPHCELFLLQHAISPVSELHNNNLLYKLESLQGDGSRTRQAIPQNAR